MVGFAVALALTAAVIHGTWNALVKVTADPIVTFGRATLAAWVVATPVAGAAWLALGRPGVTVQAARICLLSATLETTYLWLLASAYRRGELSVVYPIARGTAPLLAVLAGLTVLGERLTGLQLAGVILLLAGIAAVTLPQTSGRATVPALLTGVAIAAYTSVDRVGVRLSTPWLYAWLLFTLIGIELVGSLWLARRVAGARGLETKPPSWRQSGVIGVFMWGGYALVLWALSLAPLAVVAPVREMAVVGVAVWGVWRLRESRAAAWKLSGAAATLAGVALLAV